jgi:hypothetical protein
MQREEAIAWLRSVGRNASARDWNLRETILIAVGEPTTADGITVYPGVVYLYPTASGAWNLLDLLDRDLPDPAETYENLEAAARGAHTQQRFDSRTIEQLRRLTGLESSAAVLRLDLRESVAARIGKQGKRST